MNDSVKSVCFQSHPLSSHLICSEELTMMISKGSNDGSYCSRCNIIFTSDLPVLCLLNAWFSSDTVSSGCTSSTILEAKIHIKKTMTCARDSVTLDGKSLQNQRERPYKGTGGEAPLFTSSLHKPHVRSERSSNDAQNALQSPALCKQRRNKAVTSNLLSLLRAPFTQPVSV